MIYGSASSVVPEVSFVNRFLPWKLSLKSQQNLASCPSLTSGKPPLNSFQKDNLSTAAWTVPALVGFSNQLRSEDKTEELVVAQEEKR